jgi:hypothetical protein
MSEIKTAEPLETPIWDWFGLTRSAYFVVPRLALCAMPLDWQRRFVALMDEAEAMGLETPHYEVRRREHGQFIADPWADYRHGNFEEVHGKPLKVMP